MSNIEPQYVTFEQAKSLKEKGFDVKTRKFCITIGEYFFEKDYFNWNQTDTFVSIPEQWQVVEWLRVNHDIWITVRKDWNDGVFMGYESQLDCEEGYFDYGTFNTPQEACSAAFDYIFNNNLI